MIHWWKLIMPILNEIMIGLVFEAFKNCIDFSQFKPCKNYEIKKEQYTQRFCRDKPSYILRIGWTKSCHATCQNNT